MANGCCGDINNIDRTKPPSDRTRPYPDHRVDQVANVLAAECWKVWNQIDQRRGQGAGGDESGNGDVTVDACIRYPKYRRRTAAEEEQRVVAGGQKAIDQIGDKWPHRVDDYAREREYMDTLPLEIETVVQALRIGDLGIAGFPGEFFVEYGLNTKRNSSFERTMCIELANDWIGYVPTDQGLEQGGYETWFARTSQIAEGSEKVLTDAALNCLREVVEEE